MVPRAGADFGFNLIQANFTAHDLRPNPHAISLVSGFEEESRSAGLASHLHPFRHERGPEALLR